MTSKLAPRRRVVHLRMKTEGHNKFWKAEVVEHTKGATLTRQWGRIGTEGETTTDVFDSWEKASEQFAKLSAQKMNKGYSMFDVGGDPLPPTLDKHITPDELKHAVKKLEEAPQIEQPKPRTLADIRARFQDGD